MATATRAKQNGAPPAPPAPLTEADIRKMVIPLVQEQTIILEIRGTTPYISGKFSDKARRQMAAKQQGEAVGARKAKDTHESFLGSLHILPGMDKAEDDGKPGKYFIPGIAFKKASIAAAPYTARTVAKTKASGAQFVIGDPTIGYSQLLMREDAVRNATGVADLRYRGEFRDWYADVFVNFDSSTLSLEQLVNLHNRAGWHIGVGEWRAEKSGNSFGRYQVSQVRLPTEDEINSITFGG